jgi:hypothetical protein
MWKHVKTENQFKLWQKSQLKLVSLQNWSNTLAIFVAQEDISCQNAQDLHKCKIASKEI